MPKLPKPKLDSYKFQPKVKVGNIIEPKEEKLLIQLTAEILKCNNTVRNAFRDIMRGQAKVSTILKEYVQYKFKKEEPKVKKFDEEVKKIGEIEKSVKPRVQSVGEKDTPKSEDIVARISASILHSADSKKSPVKVPIKCPAHPKYRIIRKPRLNRKHYNNCICDELWANELKKKGVVKK